MKYLLPLFLWSLVFLGVACDESAGDVEPNAVDSRFNGLRYPDILCGNLFLDSETLAFAAQRLEDGVFEVMVEVNGQTIDWMADEHLDIEGLTCDRPMLLEESLLALDELQDALTVWLTSEDQELAAHEELAVEMLERLVAGTSIHCGHTGVWSRKTDAEK
jgi:hypothetical protein